LVPERRPFDDPGPVIALALPSIELRQTMVADAAILIVSFRMGFSDFGICRTDKLSMNWTLNFGKPMESVEKLTFSWSL
jgi:hypothetical protein